MQHGLITPPERHPRHIAVIMDGNGRWAAQRGLPRIDGHRQGAEAVRRLLRGLQETAVTHLTLYAFSVENWRRPQEEIDGLMELLVSGIAREIDRIHEARTRLNVIGRIDELPLKAREAIEKAIERTKTLDERTVTVALNYGSRTEVIDAVNRYVRLREEGKAPAELTEWEDFEPYLYTTNLPDPDLIIRTSGEHRISNFLMLQGAYSELYFTDVLWPDFDEATLYAAIEAYASRQRRFGKTGEQIATKSAETTRHYAASPPAL